VNTQPIEKQSLDRGGFVEVHHIFPTMQGEGPYAGTPAVFIRLAGCNLQCPWCDTEYTSKRQLMSPERIVREVEGLTSPSRLVVITGGEPFRQNISDMCRALVHSGFAVQIETNGTLYVDGLPWDAITVVCSPKAGKLNRALEHRVNAFKYVLHADHIDPDDGLPTRVLDRDSNIARPPIDFVGPVYVQPIDVGDAVENQRHTQAALASALKYGHILCLQMHKLIGLE